jgi:hypothetical protein
MGEFLSLQINHNKVISILEIFFHCFRFFAKLGWPVATPATVSLDCPGFTGGFRLPFTSVTIGKHKLVFITQDGVSPILTARSRTCEGFKLIIKKINSTTR